MLLREYSFMRACSLFCCIAYIGVQGCVFCHPESIEKNRVGARYNNCIKIDGNLAEWEGIEFIRVTPKNGVFETEVPYDSYAAGFSDLSYSFAVCYDDEALYVAVEVTDNVIKTDSTKPGDIEARAWEDDAVEIFLDGNHNHAPDSRDKDHSEFAFGGEFSLVINGAATSMNSGWPKSFGKDWQGATNWRKVIKGDKKLCYEFRLPWKVMGHDRVPDAIGFTIGVQDDDDGSIRDHALYWSAVAPHCWKNEKGWGDVYFLPKNGQK